MVSWLLRKGLREGFRRGLVDGERVWLVIGAAALLGQLALRAVHKRPEVVFSEKLRLGESMVITHRPGAKGR